MKKSSNLPPRSNFLDHPEGRKVDFSDIPETDESFWASAEIRVPGNKKGVYLRIDPDTLEWFKSQGKGYQTRINHVLKSYKEAHQK